MSHREEFKREFDLLCAAVYNQRIEPKGGTPVKADVIPEPQSIKIKSEEPAFSLTRLAELCSDEECEGVMAYFAKFCGEHFGLEFVGTGKEELSFFVTPDLSEESYRIFVGEDRVKIEGGSKKGAFWGVQTLLWLLFQNDCSLCALEIEDCPQSKNRGLMLDCSSWFFSPEAVKLILDAMAFHKLDVFHWKLSGNMGWRLELFENFLLSQIGSARAFTGLGKEPHSGFYSQQDVKNILAYAKERFITVVPELDFPDHTAAAVCAYPSLSCRGEETAVPTRFGDTSGCLCLGKEETYDFVFSVLDETAELFGSRYIHIGGGRSKKSPRGTCPHCLEKMKKLGTDESGLVKDFFEKSAAHLEKRGVKAIIRCNEPGFVPKNAVAEVTSAKKTEKLQTIDASVALSLPHSEFGVRECYEQSLSVFSIGTEAVLNTEYAPSMKKAGELLFPRLGAFCEKAWTKKENRSFERFLEKLDSYYAYLDLFGLFASKRKDAFPGRLKGKLEKIKNRFGR